MRIGRRVFDDGCSIPEKTLVTIGDDAVLNAGSLIQCHSLEDGSFKSDHTVIGAGACVGVDTFVHYGVTMGDGSTLEVDAFLMKGETVGPFARWHGNPATEVRPIAAAAAADQAAGTGPAFAELPTGSIPAQPGSGAVVPAARSGTNGNRRPEPPARSNPASPRAAGDPGPDAAVATGPGGTDRTPASPAVGSVPVQPRRDPTSTQPILRSVPSEPVTELVPAPSSNGSAPTRPTSAASIIKWPRPAPTRPGPINPTAGGPAPQPPVPGVAAAGTGTVPSPGGPRRNCLSGVPGLPIPAQPTPERDGGSEQAVPTAAFSVQPTAAFPVQPTGDPPDSTRPASDTTVIAIVSSRRNGRPSGPAAGDTERLPRAHDVDEPTVQFRRHR